MREPTLPEQRAGIGLRAPHYREILDSKPPVGWLEAHSENFFAAGGPIKQFLKEFCELYPMSLHGVGLSLGSTDPLSMAHLQKVKALADSVQPALISEHLCWGHAGGRHLNDLLPLPYTEEALAHVVSRIGQAQDFLGRRILIENVSSYLQFADSTIPEWEFVAEVSRRAGSGILLDVNNIYVNSVNHGFDPEDYLAAIPGDAIGEIHLAGFDRADGCLIDTHGARVAEPVWALYRKAVQRFGPKPTLIEWDTDIPELAVLLEEAEKASNILASAVMSKEEVYARAS
ncbi:MAG TPA: DUF692 domain-containing protein [Burkholderiales bacterium]|nr:DUF692 domain-containing protein [Burkholderiales bacterium]